jgi:hypothetical protein
MRYPYKLIPEVPATFVNCTRSYTTKVVSSVDYSKLGNREVQRSAIQYSVVSKHGKDLLRTFATFEDAVAYKDKQLHDYI